MTIDSLMLFAPAETSTPGSGATAYAVSLAKVLNARLSIFVVALDVTSPERKADAVAVAAAICASAEAAGVDCRTVTDHSHAIGVHEVVAEHARMHDLTVTGCSGDGLLSERQIAEYLLFGSGRPVLIVPSRHTAPFVPGQTVVAWDNTSMAARALGDARALLGDGQTVLLTIDGDKHLRGDLDSDEITTLASRRGLRVRLHSVHRGNRSIADALQEEARLFDAELLVMGAYGHSRVSRFVLGSATVGVLENLQLPALLSH